MSEDENTTVTPAFDNASTPFNYSNMAFAFQIDLKNSVLASVISIFIVLNLCGNVLVCIVLLLRMMKKYRAMSVLLLSLAVADICTAVFTMIPFQMLFVFGTFVMGEAVCKLNTLINSLVGNASILTHVLIAIERYRSLRRIDMSRSNMKAIYISVAAVWIYNLVFAIPYIFLFKIIKIFNLKICIFDAEMNVKYKTLFSVHGHFSVIVNYFIPFTIMIVCYAGVIYQLKQSMRRVAGRNMPPVNRSRQARSVALMCILVVFVFAVRSTPVQILFLVILREPTEQTFDLIMKMVVVNFALASLSPVIYGVMWKSFRQHALSLFCPCYKQKVPIDNTTIQTDGMSIRHTTKTTVVSHRETPSEIFITNQSNN